jgi:hypothetical protein
MERTMNQSTTREPWHLKRPRSRTGLTFLAFGLFIFALGAKLSWYLPQNDLVHYLCSAAKMNGERHGKIEAALATEFATTIFREDTAAAPPLPSSSGKLP